jgi:pimeloyl-ACP methyl ester carboxylesterase
MTMEKKTIIISGLKVCYWLSSGCQLDRAVVFLPGWRSPATLFCSVLGDTPNLVAVNFPGWPETETPQSVWGLAEYAGFLQEFLQKLQIKPALLIGHSVGAAIAVEYLSRGGQAERLIIIDGAVCREKSARSRALLIGAKIFRFCLPWVSPARRQRWAGKLLSQDYREAGELTEIYKRLISEDRQTAFQALKLPVVLIWGQDDQDTPLAQADQLKKKRPQTSLDIIAAAGHYCFLDQPQEFKKIISKLL